MRNAIDYPSKVISNILINCSDNKLTNLPELDHLTNLQEIDCRHNQLTSLLNSNI